MKDKTFALFGPLSRIPIDTKGIAARGTLARDMTELKRTRGIAKISDMKQNTSRAAIITDFLQKHPSSSYCDRCLGTLAGAGTSHQVNQITRLLRQAEGFARRDGLSCSNCNRERACARYLGS